MLLFSNGGSLGGDLLAKCSAILEGISVWLWELVENIWMLIICMVAQACCRPKLLNYWSRLWFKKCLGKAGIPVWNPLLLDHIYVLELLWLAD